MLEAVLREQLLLSVLKRLGLRNVRTPELAIEVHDQVGARPIAHVPETSEGAARARPDGNAGQTQRRTLVTARLMPALSKLMPRMSESERVALDAVRRDIEGRRQGGC